MILLTGSLLKEIHVCLLKCFYPPFVVLNFTLCLEWNEWKRRPLIVTQNLGEESIFLQQLFSGVASWLVIPSKVDNIGFSGNAGYLEILFLGGFQTCSGGGMKLGNRSFNHMSSSVLYTSTGLTNSANYNA